MGKIYCKLVLWVLPEDRPSEEAERLLREKGIPFIRKEMDYQKWPPGTAFRCPTIFIGDYTCSGLEAIKKVIEEIHYIGK